RSALETSMGRSIDTAADELEGFARRNDARAEAERAEGAAILPARPVPVPDPVSPPVAAPVEVPIEAPVEAPIRPPVSARPAPPAPAPAPARGDAVPRDPVPTPPEPGAQTLEGRVMTEDVRTSASPVMPANVALPASGPFGLLWPAALFVVLLGLWRWCDRR